MDLVGRPAPVVRLNDHFGRSVDTGAFRGRCQTLLLFYPLDWTPT